LPKLFSKDIKTWGLVIIENATTTHSKETSLTPSLIE